MPAETSEFDDPRLVALYDALNPFAPDTAFYLDLAAADPGCDVLDIGCGTGLLAVELAARGHAVTGVDPSEAMLQVARRRPRGRDVRWVLGSAEDAPDSSADLALMTGHVAQVFVDDAGWAAVLVAARRALRPGGRLAFESRNPAVRPWLAWTPEASRREVRDAGGRPATVWSDVLDVQDGLVRFRNHFRLERPEEALTSTSTLRFRTRDELVGSVTAAGFEVTDVLGGWDGQLATDAGRELIVLARRR